MASKKELPFAEMSLCCCPLLVAEGMKSRPEFVSCFSGGLEAHGPCLATVSLTCQAGFAPNVLLKFRIRCFPHNLQASNEESRNPYLLGHLPTGWRQGAEVHRGQFPTGEKEAKPLNLRSSKRTAHSHTRCICAYMYMYIYMSDTLHASTLPTGMLQQSATPIQGVQSSCRHIFTAGRHEGCLDGGHLVSSCF